MWKVWFIAISLIAALFLACNEPPKPVYDNATIHKDAGKLVGMSRLLDVRRDLTTARQVAEAANRIAFKHLPEFHEGNMLLSQELGISLLNPDSYWRLPSEIATAHRQVIEKAAAIIRIQLKR